MMTLRQRLLAARARLTSAGVDNNEAVLDTNLLARHVLGWSRSDMLLRQDDPPPAGFEEAFHALPAAPVRVGGNISVGPAAMPDRARARS